MKGISVGLEKLPQTPYELAQWYYREMNRYLSKPKINYRFEQKSFSHRVGAMVRHIARKGGHVRPADFVERFTIRETLFAIDPKISRLQRCGEVTVDGVADKPVSIGGIYTLRRNPALRQFYRNEEGLALFISKLHAEIVLPVLSAQGIHPDNVVVITSAPHHPRPAAAVISSSKSQIAVVAAAGRGRLRA